MNDTIDNSLLIIIPALNEEKNINQVISEIPEKIDGVNNVKCLVVDDGSSDKTKEVAQKAGADVISHSQKKGVGAALATGIDYALKGGFDIAVNIDADKQFDPKEIPELIKPVLYSQADLVVGDRFNNGKPKNMPSSKYLGNQIMTKLINYLSGGMFGDVSCGFRAYSIEAMLNLNLFGKFTYTQESILDMMFKGLSVQQVPVSVKYYTDRESKVAKNLFTYTWKTLSIILRSIVYFKPLKFFGYPGLALLIVGMFFTTFLVWHRIVFQAYSPYKAFGFIGGGLMIFGVIMIFIGLVADMVGRIRLNQDRILYYEKKKVFKK